MNIWGFKGSWTDMCPVYTLFLVVFHLFWEESKGEATILYLYVKWQSITFWFHIMHTCVVCMVKWEHWHELNESYNFFAKLYNNLQSLIPHSLLLYYNIRSLFCQKQSKWWIRTQYCTFFLLITRYSKRIIGIFQRKVLSYIHVHILPML